MKLSFDHDPSARAIHPHVHKSTRAGIAFVALALLGSTVDHATHHTSSSQETAAPHKMPPAHGSHRQTKAEIAFDRTEQVQIEYVKQAAVVAAQKIIEGLAMPGVDAKNYDPSNLNILGNAYNVATTGKPETIAHYFPDENAVGISSVSLPWMHFQNPVSIDLVFALTGHSSIASQGNLTLEGLNSAFRNPAGLELIGADVSSSPQQGVGIISSQGRLRAFSGPNTYNTAYAPLSLAQDEHAGIPVTSSAQLHEIAALLNNELNIVGSQLLEQFATPEPRS